MRIKPLKNLSFWAPVLLSAAVGIGVGIAETEGFVHAGRVFLTLGLIGVIYFVTTAFVLPYRRLKVSSNGFSLATQNERHDVQWSDVIEVQIFRENNQLEWILKTKRPGIVCIMDDEYLYRSRLRKNATERLKDFDDDALQQAIDSREDGVWTCFAKR